MVTGKGCGEDGRKGEMRAREVERREMEDREEEGG